MCIALANLVLAWFSGQYLMYREELRVVAELHAQGTVVDLRLPEVCLFGLAPALTAPHEAQVEVKGTFQPDLALVARLRGPVSLTLQGTRLGRGQIMQLGRIRSLWFLSLSRVSLEAESWAPLGQVKSLRWLVVSETPLAGGLREIGRLEALERLILDRCALADQDLRPLENLRRLNCLVIREAAFRGAGLVYLKDLPALAKLDLRSCSVSDEFLPPLLEFPVLRHLRLSENPITDQGLPLLARLPWVEWLDLSGTLVSDEGIQAFAGDRAGYLAIDVENTRVTSLGATRLEASAPNVLLWMDRSEEVRAVP